MTALSLAERRALAAWLVEANSEDCLVQLGIGKLTAERIAAGEVEPEPDILIRIAAQTAPLRTLLPSFTHGDGQLAAGIPSEGAGGLFSDCDCGPPFCCACRQGRVK